MNDSNLPLFSKLSSKKQQACVLKAEGTKVEAIAAEIGVVFKTVYRWFNDIDGLLIDELNEYKGFLASKKVNSALDLEQRSKEYAEKALLRLATIALDESTPQRLAILYLDSLLDRTGQPRKSESKSETTLKGMNAEEKAERYKKAEEILQRVRPEQLRAVS